MKKVLENYLKKIQRNESIFPIDSPHKVRKPLDVNNPRHDWEDVNKEDEEDEVVT